MRPVHLVAATSWSPEQWTALGVTMLTALSGAIVSVIGAVRTRNLHNEVRPPSNGATLGALVEGIGQVQHMLAGLGHAPTDLPAAMTVARQIQTAAAADPALPDVAPPERRLTDAPPTP